MKQKTYITTSYDEVEALILEHYNVNIELLSEEEMGSSQWHAFTTVIPDKGANPRSYGCTSYWMYKLMMDEHIPPATEYLMEVWW